MADGTSYSLYSMGQFDELGSKEIDGAKGRVMLGSALGLTGCEVSLNSLPAGGFIPFVHAHKINEEVYMILKGTGLFYIDGEEIPIAEGDMLRVAPGGRRAIKANDPLTYVCIQAQKDSLTQATQHDGIILEDKASWMS